jgi:hypothetical protein
MPPDPALCSADDVEALVDSFCTHGCRHAWHLNDDANMTHARTAPNAGRLLQPKLFVNGNFDQICSIDGNSPGDPMRAADADLTVTRMPSGQRLTLERNAEHIGVIRSWLWAKAL